MNYYQGQNEEEFKIFMEKVLSIGEGESTVILSQADSPSKKTHVTLAWRRKNSYDVIVASGSQSRALNPVTMAAGVVGSVGIGLGFAAGLVLAGVAFPFVLSAGVGAAALGVAGVAAQASSDMGHSTNAILGHIMSELRKFGAIEFKDGELLLSQSAKACG